MAYTITITTPIEYVNDSDYIQMIIVFDVNLEGVNESHNALDKGIRVHDWGERELRYDMEDPVLVPGVYSCKLSDAAGYLESLLFNPTGVGAGVQKNPLVELKLNGVSEYKGIVAEDGLNYNKGNKILTLSIDPGTSILNKLNLRNPKGGAINPLGLTDIPYPLYSTLLKIYSKVNGNVNIHINHDWIFQGRKLDILGGLTSTTLSDILINEVDVGLKMCSDNSGRFQNMETVGDLLRSLAMQYCAFTGMLDNNNAFFSKLFYFNSGNLQTMGTKLSHEMEFSTEYVDLVKIHLEIPGLVSWQYTGGDDFIYIYRNTLEKELYVGFRVSDSEHGTDNPLTSNMTAVIGRGGGADGFYSVFAVKDPALDNTWQDNGALFAKFWYHYRNEAPSIRIDKFTFIGLNYSFIKNFVDDRNKYQIVRLRKKYSKNTTDIDAIHLGVV